MSSKGRIQNGRSQWKIDQNGRSFLNIQVWFFLLSSIFKIMIANFWITSSLTQDRSFYRINVRVRFLPETLRPCLRNLVIDELSQNWFQLE